MRRLLLICATILAIGLYAGVGLAQQGMQQQGMQQQGQAGWFCPWCGQQSGQAGPGMMRGSGQWGPGMQGRCMGHGMRSGPQGRGMMHHGYGMNRGMMHRGHGPGQGRRMGPGMMHRGWDRDQYPSAQGERMQPMNESKARMLLQEYVAANPNLEVGGIKEKDEVYVGRIETKDGSLVEKVLVDKQTGWMKKTY